MEEIERRRTRFLKNFRQLLERELEDVDVEELKEPVDQPPIELDLGRPKGVAPDEPEEQVEQMRQDAGEPATEPEDLAPLDAGMNALADGYRADVESLFREKRAGEGEADLFSLPKDNPEEDTRWG